jgi:hypothetical protein
MVYPLSPGPGLSLSQQHQRPLRPLWKVASRLPRWIKSAWTDSLGGNGGFAGADAGMSVPVGCWENPGGSLVK